MRGPIKAERIGENNDSLAEIETLKTEVLKSITCALESNGNHSRRILDFPGQSGVNFYEEVTKFEIELIKRALNCTRGNQRAAARLLCMKATTLNSKVKTYNLIDYHKENHHE